MSIQTEALAFRVWAVAKPKDWDCTVQEIAEAVGETPQRIAGICRVKGWTERLRSSGPDYRDTMFAASDAWNSSDPLIGEESHVD